MNNHNHPQIICGMNHLTNICTYIDCFRTGNFVIELLSHQTFESIIRYRFVLIFFRIESNGLIKIDFKSIIYFQQSFLLK